MKHMSSRKGAAAAIVAAAALATAACGGGGSSAKSPGQANLSAPATKSGTLSMVTKFADPKYAPYFEGVVKAYQQANPGVTIKLE